jgi:MFS family permease
VVASLIIGYAKKWSNKTMFTFVLLCFVVYCACLPFTTAMWQLYILQMLCGVANGGMMSLAMACAMENAQPGCRTTTMAVFQASYGIGMTLGPILMGVLVDYFGYMAGFMSMAVLCVVSIAVVRLKLKSDT